MGENESSDERRRRKRFRRKDFRLRRELCLLFQRSTENVSGTDKINFLRSAQRRKQIAQDELCHRYSRGTLISLFCSDIRDDENANDIITTEILRLPFPEIMCISAHISLQKNRAHPMNSLKLRLRQNEFTAIVLLLSPCLLSSCCRDSQMKLTLLHRKFQLKHNINDKFYVLYTLSGKCTVK